MKICFANFKASKGKIRFERKRSQISFATASMKVRDASMKVRVASMKVRVASKRVRVVTVKVSVGL